MKSHVCIRVSVNDLIRALEHQPDLSRILKQSNQNNDAYNIALMLLSSGLREPILCVVFAGWNTL